MGPLLLAAVAIAAAAAAPLSPTSVARLAARDTLDPLPPWNYADMAAATLANLPTESAIIVDLRLLVWQGMIDDRPVHVEQVLFWAELNLKAGGKRWALVQLGRNPDEADVFREWDLYVVNDTPWNPVKLFEHAPDNADVYSFLERWPFSPQAPWRVLTAGVRERTWKHATGKGPTTLYPRVLSNNAVNATVLASRRLQGKRRATRPARYRGRYAD
jgi:hypothetical protein